MDIVVEDLEYVYSPRTPMELKALAGISLTIPAGTVLAILGMSGSGKTTLLKTLNGLLAPTSGKILIDGHDIREFGPELRKRVGLVFQQPERQVFENTVLNDISFVLNHFSDLSQKEIQKRVALAAEMVGLELDKLANRAPWTLSDGQKRLVAMAGIMTNDPEVLILDEPTVGLGPEAIQTIFRLIERLKKDKKRSVILVSHQIDAFVQQVDKIAVLDKGGLAACGTPAEVCEALGDNLSLRPLLPEPALLIYDLRRRGANIPPDEYNLRKLAQWLVRIMRKDTTIPANTRFRN